MPKLEVELDTLRINVNEEIHDMGWKRPEKQQGLLV